MYYLTLRSKNKIFAAKHFGETNVLSLNKSGQDYLRNTFSQNVPQLICISKSMLYKMRFLLLTSKHIFKLSLNLLLDCNI